MVDHCASDDGLQIDRHYPKTLCQDSIMSTWLRLWLLASLSAFTGAVCPQLHHRHLPVCECREENYRVYLVCTGLYDLQDLVDTLPSASESMTSLWLRVDSGVMQDVSSRSFTGLRLHSVQINASNVTYVDTEAFVGVEGYLRFLGLQDNLLEEVPTHALRRLQRLEMLSLAGNMIPAVPYNTFQGMANLRYLSLTHNIISNVERGSFGTNLHHLALSGNRLTSLNNSVKHLAHLEWLLLSSNHLSAIDGQLEHLSSLTFLALGDNRIYEIGSSFSSPTNAPQRLHVLNLSRNRLSRVPNGSFAALAALRQLDLSRNILSSMGPHAFTGLKSLIDLDLADNRLASLGGALEYLSNLRLLNVSGNLLTSLEAQQFENLVLLDTIDLSRNRLNAIDGTSQLRLPSLKTLWAGDNKLTSIQESLNMLPRLQQLDLSYNYLAHLSKDTFAHNSDLRTLRIKGNPWVCNNNFVRVMLQLEANLTQIDEKPWCMNAVVQLDVLDMDTP